MKFHISPTDAVYDVENATIFISPADNGVPGAFQREVDYFIWNLISFQPCLCSGN